ncbi:threonine ammonia-lyase, biosynthetic [Beggiatoa leptomitoformis]|uniref:L-threonine dehydratase n=1 Tax=Beggiatoa leptomitoformis TaxID=288004 RepID=A0A2N9YAR6_9GAMM|nr:threonine ammonia-lyase, biosynthetic [Beggiatoa leptomitoformis]ALG67059.1 threonine ammonia-lyase, biosynthetic [Beggiatoa leptomitoformis]AUI67556.1 threonine ammonia-lyase, biosynthetic [Beggiatoa leptomitoformis]
MLTPYIKKILQSRVYDVAEKTRLDEAKNLSKRLNNHIWIKREDMQPVFSFKIRGAYNKIANLPPELSAKGVIAVSAGNHAQGVALSATRLKIPAVIVMPTTTPDIKVRSVQHYGVEVILHGATFDEAYQHTQQLTAERQLTFIPPYDDVDVIAGQGTIGMEILQQHSSPIDAIFVPVGGGGLIAGIAAYVKYCRPEIKIIGVEPEESACMYEALRAGERVTLAQVGLFADGVAVKQAGKLPFELARHYVDDVLLVSTDEICAAIKDIFEDTRTVTEPAGALSLAGLKRYIQQENCTEKQLIAIASGANMNFDRLGYVTERTEIGEKREALLAVTIPEHPGSFREFCNTIGLRAITEFNYRYADARDAHVFVGLRLSQGQQEKQNLLNTLNSQGYAVVDMTDNEMAKLHIRHLVGGRAQSVANERLYRFEFPERPSALLHFLTLMGHRWNISLFHYRNHGAAEGRVLVGIQVADTELDEFKAFLQKLAYPSWEEANNPAYHLFLN